MKTPGRAWGWVSASPDRREDGVPGQGNRSRAEGPGQEGPASREGLGFSSVSGAAEGLEQRVAAPGSASGASAAYASWTQRASAVPGPRPGSGRAAGRPLQARGAGGPGTPLPWLTLVAQGPLCPGSRWRHFSRPSSPQSGPCVGLITQGAENEAPQAAHEASL